MTQSSTSGKAERHALRPTVQFDGPVGGCVLSIDATVELGPTAGQSFQGTLTISVGPDGAIDTGTLQFSDGSSVPVVGQATGRSIRLRAGSAPDTTITFIGSGVFAIDQCSGEVTGAFVGPGLQTIGVWIATGTTGA
jgi:hypothetical protein